MKAAAWNKPAGKADWTILLPFFNERDCIARTISSLARQTTPFNLILIDNGSRDGGAAVAQAASKAHGLESTLVTEERPGKVAALAAGLARVDTFFVATCDADTLYPSHYLAAAQAVLAQGHAGAGAYFVDESSSRLARRLKCAHIMLAARLLRRQCHAGGAGQAFRTAALRGAGGFDPSRWNLILEDHEIMHRLMALGTVGYARDLWAMPSARPRRRASVRWGLLERLVYHLSASLAPDWYFTAFLGPRLLRQSLTSDRLRETPEIFSCPKDYA